MKSRGATEQKRKKGKGEIGEYALWDGLAGTCWVFFGVLLTGQEFVV